MPAVSYQKTETKKAKVVGLPPQVKKDLLGVDVYVHTRESDVAKLGEKMKALGGEFELKTISSKGLKIWPEGIGMTNTDVVNCRFMTKGATTHAATTALLSRIAEAGVDFIKTENLYQFGDTAGFSLGQGE
jgi:isocitrate dehydrogenase